MRVSLLSLLAALTIVGCDSTGPDSFPGTGGGAALTFATVSPVATYLRAPFGTPSAQAYRLADFDLAPGQTACFRASGDFRPYVGLLASERAARDGTPVVTGVFSASTAVSDTGVRNRVTGAVGGSWGVVTRPLYGSDIETNTDEDFDATNACYVVPAGATTVLFSVYDDAYDDNSDALVGGRPFGVTVSRQ